MPDESDRGYRTVAELAVERLREVAMPDESGRRYWVKPEWLAPRQHASEPLTTPWSPAVLDARDEHAQESQDAEARAREDREAREAK